MRTPFEPSLVLANFDEVFSHDTNAKGTWSWQKAMLVPDSGCYVLVVPADTPNLLREPAAWSSPKAVIVPSQVSSQLCQDLLEDPVAWRRLVAELPVGVPVRLWAQVFSPWVEAIARALIVAGFEVDTGLLPRVSALTVRYWNTKIGGRDLLLSVSAARHALPKAVTCNTLTEVLALVAETTSQRGLVVKLDRSFGGAGVRFFPANVSRTHQQIASSIIEPPFDVNGVKKRKVNEDIKGPFLVEEMIGTPSANRSPTVDFIIESDGSAQFIGMADQRLGDGVRYMGARYSPEGKSKDRKKCVDLGGAICAELSRRGYRGFVNVDFIVDPSGKVYIAEINLRQSAPLDQFIIMRRLFGENWLQERAFACLEDEPVPIMLNTIHAMTKLNSAPSISVEERVMPLAIYDNDKSRCASLLCISSSGRSVQRLVNEISAALEKTLRV